jgi:hypothetical protein
MVEMAIFNDQNNREDVESLKLMHVYRIEKCAIVYPSQQYRVWDTKYLELHYDLHCVARTIFTELPIDPENVVPLLKRAKITGLMQNDLDEPRSKNDVSTDNNDEDAKNAKTEKRKRPRLASASNYISFDKVLLESKGKFVNLIGIVCKFDTDIYTAGKTNQQARNFFLVDQCGLVIRCVLWGKEAQLQRNIEIGSVILLKEARIAEYRGIYLSKDMKTQMVIMNLKQTAKSLIPEVVSLRSWWEENYDTVHVISNDKN